MDVEGANPDNVKRQLAELNLISEEWGGDTIFVEVSAKTGQGLDDLVEMLALQSEVLELKANPDRPGRGIIIEAKLDRGRGPVATVLVKTGTFKTGDIVVAGTPDRRPFRAGRGAGSGVGPRCRSGDARGRDRASGPRHHPLPHGSAP